MKDLDVALLKKLVEIDSVSGDEKAISLALKAEYEPYADEIVYDNLGSIFAVKKSNKVNAPHVMISGHMDEAGIIVKKCLANGLIKGLVLGELAATSLLGARVRLVKNNGEKILGTLVAYNEEGQVLDDKKEVLIDFGFESQAEIKEAGIQLGERVAFSGDVFTSQSGQRIFAKNLNGRYAALLGIDLLKTLADTELPFDLYVGCTVQEQVGFRGVQTATNVVAPDLGVMLDMNQAFDYQTKVKDKIGELGKGLLINFYDTSVLPNRLLLTTLKKLVKEHDIAHQFYYSLEDSDAAWVNKLRTGTPTLFINIPARNVNTATEIIDKRDYTAASTALELFIRELTPEKIQAFKEENR